MVICHVIVGVDTQRDMGVSFTVIRCVRPSGRLPRVADPFCDGVAEVVGMKLGDGMLMWRVFVPAALLISLPGLLAGLHVISPAPAVAVLVTAVSIVAVQSMLAAVLWSSRSRPAG